MLYAVPIHSRMPTRCKIAAWPYQCLLTQNADRCSRAAGILARARLLLVVASIIRGDGPNELCESIEPISARERCLKNNALHASRLLRWSCAGGCPRQVTAAHVERPSARHRPGRSPGGARAPSGPIGRLRVAASGCQRLTPSLPWSPTGDQARASHATAFRAIVQLRRPRHFDSPPTQHHAYPSRSSRQSSRMRRDEPVSIR
jgi:hypothetical protein